MGGHHRDVAVGIEYQSPDIHLEGAVRAEDEVHEAEIRIASIRKRQAEHEKELQFYKGKNEPPAKLRDDIKNAADELKAHEQLLELKKREVDSINARYDEDKKRYAALNAGR